MKSVFLSHSSKDKDDVQRLADDLKAAGFKVWLDVWEIKVGQSVSLSIEKGIENSDFLAIWLTESAISSGWVDKEWRAKFNDEVTSRKNVVLPLLTESLTSIPALLRDKLYADFRKSYATGLEQLLSALRGGEDDRSNIRIRSSWESYGWLFNLGGYRVPYIPLLADLSTAIELRTIDQLSCQRDMVPYKLPQQFKDTNIYTRFRNDPSCRLSHHTIKGDGSLELTFSETTYRDYLKSGEHLDDPSPDQPDKTFRDVFGHLVMEGGHNLRPFDLTNICGVGLFIISSDNYVIVSKHSKSSHVYPGRTTYSASGTMKWGASPNPFATIILKSFEEIRHQINLRSIRLVDMGADARKLYFQFSFVDSSLDDFQTIRKRCGSRVQLTGVPLEADTVAQALIEACWEPAAEASLLFYAIHRFGYENIFNELLRFRGEWTRKQMIDEWDYRASRTGFLPDMSVRYPLDQLENGSDEYVSAVFTFLGDQTRNKDVLEIGPGTGRLTERLVASAARVTCVEFSEPMLKLHGARMKRNGNAVAQVRYKRMFAQDYAERNHDIAISSLVLIHNVGEQWFDRLVEVLCNSADIVFVFEDVSVGRKTSPHTLLRPVDRLVTSFANYGFSVSNLQKYSLFGDDIAFLKFARTGIAIANQATASLDSHAGKKP